MIKQFVVLLMVAAFAHSSGARPSNGPAGSSTSARRLEHLRIEEFGAFNALGEISQKAHVMIGVDAVEPKKESTVVLDFPGGTVADLLNLFVSQEPEYQWAESSAGIIRVSRNNAHVSLLDVVISYPEPFKKTRRDIWEDLGKNPQVSEWMQSSHCSPATLFNGKEFRDHNDPISIEPGSRTVAALLDEVAVKSGVNYWAVLQSAPGTQCYVNIILW
jgi:hypothetical protein